MISIKPAVIFLALSSVTLLFTSSCISINVNGTEANWAMGDYKKVNGNGHVITQNRNVAGFTSINKNGSIDMQVMKGDTAQVQVIADDNLQEYMITEVRNGILYVNVKSNITITGSHKLLAIVTVPDLTSLDQNGSGDVSISSFAFNDFHLAKNGSGDLQIASDASELFWSQDGSGDVIFNGNIGEGNISIDGSGDVKLEGKANHLQVNKNGSGDLSAFGMAVKQMQFNKDGSGDASIRVTDSLTTDMKGSGDIYSKGNPAGDVKVSGSGDFHHVQ